MPGNSSRAGITVRTMVRSCFYFFKLDSQPADHFIEDGSYRGVFAELGDSGAARSELLG